jgi:SMI1 / KNR4 family (SUKH-1)
MTANNQTFQPNAPAPSEAIASLRAALPKPLPEGYVAFLQRANGGEGFLGERYVQLWRAEELLETNRGYKVAEFFPNLFLIGTDGGGEAYAFDVSGNDASVFEVPFIGMPSDARAIANSFDSFIAALGT